MSDPFKIIHTYTRKQAIDDGILIDITSMAKEAGINWSVAITSTVWDNYIVPSNNLKYFGQSEKGRLWDVIIRFLFAASNINRSKLIFRVIFLMTPRQKKVVTLKAIAGQGDNGEPVITIMLPEED